MEYLEGVNAGLLKTVPPEYKHTLSNEIVDNLLSWHKVENPLGYGELNANYFALDWRDYYYNIAESVLKKAEILSN